MNLRCSKFAFEVGGFGFKFFDLGLRNLDMIFRIREMELNLFIREGTFSKVP